MSQDLKDRAIRYLRALEDRDWKSARGLCAETATVWHNDGKGEQSIEENIAGMEGLMATIESMRYDVLRQLSQPGEVLQQHVIHVATTSGTHGEVHAAVYFGFDEAGRIRRIEEYANFVPVGGQDG
ncbi:nuclear transport factor 2 family protein [Nocardiopsis dassonvillei]|uniref:nuclear transport factor 2 family protein n=1 Tax=Nocardiopsis dassonvillei TaxID=2014 RepID=UPI0033DF170B